MMRLRFENIRKHPITTLCGLLSFGATLFYHCVQFYFANAGGSPIILTFGLTALVIGALMEDPN